VIPRHPDDSQESSHPVEERHNLKAIRQYSKWKVSSSSSCDRFFGNHIIEENAPMLQNKIFYDLLPSFLSGIGA
jgi:hypothetical protein